MMGAGALTGGAIAAANGGDGWDILKGSMLGFGAGMLVGAAPFYLQGLFSGGGAGIASTVGASAASTGLNASTLMQAGSVAYQLGNLVATNPYSGLSDPQSQLYAQSRYRAYESDGLYEWRRQAAGGGGGIGPQTSEINLDSRSGALSSNAARRAAMRMNNTPTSRAAVSQSGSAGKKQYITTGSDGRPRVQTQHGPDSEHPSGHVHDSEPKVDPMTGKVLRNKYGQIKYKAGGSFVPYE